MQQDGEDNSDRHGERLAGVGLVEGEAEHDADAGGGDGVQEGRADETRVADEDALHDAVVREGIVEEERVFGRRETERRGDGVDERVDRLVVVGGNETEYGRREEFQHLFDGRPHEDGSGVAQERRRRMFEWDGQQYHRCSGHEGERDAIFRLRLFVVFHQPEKEPDKRR